MEMKDSADEQGHHGGDGALQSSGSRVTTFPLSMAAARHKTAHDNAAAPLGNQDAWLRK